MLISNKLNLICLSFVVLISLAGCSDETDNTTPDSPVTNTVNVIEINTTDNNEQETENIDQPVSKELPEIIWLGDSLTQGSLGDDNGNINNPQAPWRILADKYKLNITGYGYYGYVAHDIFWKYGEDGGTKSNDRIYIFWVGANDFTESADNISKVIEEIDHFIEAGNIDKYIVLGTTNREILSPDALKLINDTFSDKYGDLYLDIVPYTEFGIDNTHLTIDSYSQIADAVYEKLINTF